MEKVNIPTIKRSTLTAKEAATYLGVSIDKIYQMVREKESIPHFRIGSRILLKKEALDQWIDEMIEESIKNEH